MQFHHRNIKSICQVFALLAVLSACGHSGSTQHVTSSTDGQTNGFALPFAASTFPNPSDLKAILDCPDGQSVNMVINNNVASGTCTNVTPGTGKFFVVHFNYGTNAVELARATSPPTTITAGTNPTINFTLNDYDETFDDDSDGYTNLYEVIHGMDPKVTNYHLSGTANGMTGTLVLANGTDQVTVNPDGSFKFAIGPVSGDTYNIAVVTQPAGQTCNVTQNGSGTVQGDVTNIAVTCATNFTIGGTLSGLATDNHLELQNNGNDNLTLTTDGSFTFSKDFTGSTTYNAIMLTLPVDQKCSISNNVGSVSGASFTNITIGCNPKFTWTSVSTPMSSKRQYQTATLLPTGKILIAGGYDGSSYLSSAELYDPDTGNWSSAGNMLAARASHTATVLPNATKLPNGTLLPKGAVLVAGGYDGTNYLNSAELYDPVSNTWSAATSMTNGREYHTATLLPTGKVLVAGGYVSAFTSTDSAELYDPATNTWSAAATMKDSRSFHTATVLPTGKILLVGGTGIKGGTTTQGFLNTAELYDPDNDTWSYAASMQNARDDHSATLMSDGIVLVAGGLQPIGATTSAELYDPMHDSWSPAANMTTGRQSHTATLLPNGVVLVAGGSASVPLNSAEIYDPANNTWTAANSLTYTRENATATLLPTGKVLVAGGYGASAGSALAPLASAELYNFDQTNNAWSTANSLITARAYHTASRLPNGKVLIAGGNDGTGATKSAELYDPASNTWSAAANLSTARESDTATLLANGKVLVAGGFDGTNYLSSTEIYDPAQDTWTATANMNNRRRNHSATLLPNGKVLVVGGDNSSGYLTSAELYNPANNTWSNAASLPTGTGRILHTATLLPNGEVLIAGGVFAATGYTNTAELYDPDNDTWTAAANMTDARASQTSNLLPNGTVLTAGGGNSVSGYLASAELYDPANIINNTWTAAASMAATGRRFHAATLLPTGLVLVAGGDGGTPGAPLNTAELYNWTTDTWSSATNMTTVRDYFTSTLLPNGKVLVVGGRDTTGMLGSVELYQ